MHVLRNALAHAGKGQRQMVLAMINTVFAQESLAIAQWRVVADQLRSKFPKLIDKVCEELMRNMKPDSGSAITSFTPQ